MTEASSPCHLVTQILRKIWGVANVRWVGYPCATTKPTLFSVKWPGHTELVCLLTAIFGDIWREQLYVYTVSVAARVEHRLDRVNSRPMSGYRV